MKSIPGRKKAYILMEVMLAAGIFAMAGVGLAVALNDISKTYIQARKISGIQTELASRLNEIRVKAVVPGKETEPADKEGVIYTKEVALLPLTRMVRSQGATSTLPMNGYYRITVGAEWMEGKNSQNEKAEIYKYQP